MSKLKSAAQLEVIADQRRQNAEAQRAGQSLPFPNYWDALDPTKLPANGTAATRQAIVASTREFLKLCPPKPRRRHTI